MLRRQDNITNTIIAKNIDRSGAVTAGTVVTPALLANGEVVITDPSLQVLTTTTVLTQDHVFIVQGRGANAPLKKYVIKGKDIKSYLGTRYEPAVEQVSYVGFNGTSGSIDEIADNNYILRINRRPEGFVRGNTNWYKYITAYTGSTPVQANIADQFAASFYANFVKAGDLVLEDWIKMERIVNDAGTAITGTATTWTVVKGSKYITLNGTVTNVVAGDYVRLGGLTVSDPVYKVASITSPTQVVLDSPYQGDSATLTEASAVEVIDAATAAAADFGLKFTGKPYKFDLYRWAAYEKVNFKLGLENFGATTVTYAVGAEAGVGVYPQVALDDHMSWANDGQTYIDQTPFLIRFNDAVSGETYSSVSLKQYKAEQRLTGAGGLESEILLYLSVTAGNPHTLPGQATGSNTDFMDVLDAYAAQYDFTAQVNNLD